MIPTVTVVIPTFNSASLLPAAIASVRSQQWPNLDLIVVDDGSTDETEQVLDALARDGGLCWFRQDNAGAAAARNRGIKAATGDWIAFLDADDVWLPDKLATQFEALEKAGADFSFTDSRLRFANGEEHDLPCPVLTGPLMPQLMTGSLFGTPTVVVRRRCFERVGYFDEQLRTGEDWDMWLRLASAFTHAWVPEPLCLVKISTSPKFPIVTFEQCTLRVLERLFSCKHLAKEWPEVVAKRRLIYAWHYSVLAKSYLRERRIINSFRLASRAVASHPLGFQYLRPARKELLLK
jgi:glycosyltransferase involved in cell wall biosynthesis